MDRRRWLKGVAATSGLIWVPALANDSTGVEKTVNALTDNTRLRKHQEFFIKVPGKALLSAVVPVQVSASMLRNVTRLHVLIDRHPVVEVARLDVAPGTEPILAVHIRLEKPCRITALAKTNNGWFQASGRVAELQSGCGSE
ncbi:MAG: thiosulfate oxidation carrier protein SoxY [Granulosicoccus sp.]